MTTAEKNEAETIYKWIIEKVSNVYESNQKIKVGDLLDWVNSRCKSSGYKEYGNMRYPVIKACWKRANSSQREALEESLLNKDGKPLL